YAQLPDGSYVTHYPASTYTDATSTSVWPDRVVTEWTLVSRRTNDALLVDCVGLFLRHRRLVRRAGPPDEVPDRDRFHARRCGMGTRRGGNHRHSRPDHARRSVGSDRSGVDLDSRMRRLCCLLRVTYRHGAGAIDRIAIRDGIHARLLWLRT